MLAPTQRQSNLFFLPLARQVSLLKDDLLDPVDKLLDDPDLVGLVRQCLATRSPHSTTTGRHGIAPDRLLRCCVLKHVKGWSFRDLARELCSNLLYRRFTGFDEDLIPDYSVFSRTFALLAPVTPQIHERVVGVAREQKVARGDKMRTDTTVVESNIHYPTDSTLLGDGIRVLTRCLGRVAEQCQGGALKVVNHARSVKHRLLEICRAAKCQTEANRQRMEESYHRLVSLAQGVVRQARTTIERFAAGRLRVLGNALRVEAQIAELQHFLPLLEKVVAQTRERIWGGNTHVEGKILSLFEPHTEVIRKGKVHKPNEFGRLVRIDEVENGIISNVEVLEGNPADTNSFLPAVKQHVARWGRAPRSGAADRGYYSAQNEREARELGMEKVVLPARGRLSQTRTRLQKQRWFRRGLRWRAGIEATISTLKHPFSMLRAMYKGESGFKRYVEWCVIAKNLVSIARHQERRRKDAPPES